MTTTKTAAATTTTQTPIDFPVWKTILFKGLPETAVDLVKVTPRKLGLSGTWISHSDAVNAAKKIGLEPCPGATIFYLKGKARKREQLKIPRCFGLNAKNRLVRSPLVVGEEHFSIWVIQGGKEIVVTQIREAIADKFVFVKPRREKGQ